MIWVILLCFAVGASVLMLFSAEGRGCLGAAIGLVFLVVFVIALGAAVIFGIIYLLTVL